MPQTILAILALAMASLIALQRYQAIILSEMGMIQNEIAMIATGVAKDRLAEVSVMAFDENTVGEAQVLIPGGLTAAASFGKEAGSFNDVDDFHLAVDTIARGQGSEVLRFRVETRVSYATVADPDAETVSATKVKKVTALVTSLDSQRPDTIRISQSFSCGSLCTW